MANRLKAGSSPRSAATAFAGLVLLILPCLAWGQVIDIKTVPLATGNQFQVFPSRNGAAGGIAIAIDDPLLDPFVNPARGRRLSGQVWTASPSYYHLTGGLGSGKSLPLAVLMSSGAYFAGAALAVQQLGTADTWRLSPTLAEQSRSNTYLFGMLGRRFADDRAGIGASLFWADLHGMDGVELLYPGSDVVRQYGGFLDLRLGFAAGTPRGGELEALLLYQNLDMTHDVGRGWIWQEDFGRGAVRLWDRHLDRSHLWGIHLSASKSMGEQGVRLGGILTLNRKQHPKIPNYELMNIPRDPGDSWAFNLGLGVSRRGRADEVGLDLIYEPVFTKTWADAGSFLTAADGRIIPPWGHTVDNSFRFSNALLRFGFMHHEPEGIGVSAGIESRLIAYRLVQRNHLAAFTRRLRERWVEWRLTWGLVLGLAEGELRYLGSVTTGTGLPGVRHFNWADRSALAAQDILIAPEGALTLQGEHLFTHQIGISLPFGGSGTTTR